MKIIYAAVAAFVIISLILLGASFFYLDRQNHGVFSYIVNINGRDAKTIRIDEFRTEDKRIYKSAELAPFSPYGTEYKERITLGKDGAFEDYVKEVYEQNEIESVYIRKNDAGASFVGKFASRFACLDNIPGKNNLFVFDETSPVTYMPIILNYNFEFGASQAFETLTPFSSLLPPVKRLVTLTSIKDEYLKIGMRKIKTENLILKIRGYPKGALWIAKSDRAVIKIEIPDIGLSITRNFAAREIKAKKYVFDGEGTYSSKDITFGHKNALVYGTLSVPAKKEKSPAVVLVQGFGPQDRSYLGFFDSLADKLAKGGYVVLRFDKRGSGSSSGSSVFCTFNDEIEDIRSAISYLSSNDAVFNKRIAIIAHAEGADSAIRVSVDNDSVKALALLSPSFFLNEEERLKEIKVKASGKNWTSDYLQLAERCIKETSEKVNSVKGDWAYILDTRCFLADMSAFSKAAPVREEIKKINIPVLILQGKKDENMTLGYAPLVDYSLEEAGNIRRVMTYYGYLDSFLGATANDGIHRERYDIDEGVARDITGWLNTNIPAEV